MVYMKTVVKIWEVKRWGDGERQLQNKTAFK